MESAKYFTLIDCKSFGHTEGSFPNWKFVWEVTVKLQVDGQEEHHVNSGEELVPAMCGALVRALHTFHCLKRVALYRYYINGPDPEGMFNASVVLSGDDNIWPADGRGRDCNTASLRALVIALDMVISDSLAINNASQPN